MARVVMVLMGVAAAGLLAVMVVAVASMGRNGSLVPDRGVGQAPGLEGLEVPRFSLVDEHAEPVDEGLFEGRVSILAFTFTNCPFICPGINAEMIRIGSAIAGTGVQRVSISVDPDRDTPEALAVHKESLGVTGESWKFLTGDIREVRRILGSTLQYTLIIDESTAIELDDGTTMANIEHPPHLVLVGPDRRVMFITPYSMPDQVDELVRRARALSRG